MSGPHTESIASDAPSPSSRLWIGCLALAFVVFACGLWAVRDFVPDDTFITLRYARNWAEGFGPVFEPTLARAEGCTSFLWLAICAAGTWLGGDPLAVARWVGIVLAAATLPTVALLARHLGAGRWSPLAAVWLACSPDFWAHANAGMETAAAILAATALLVEMTRDGNNAPRPWVVAGWALALGLLRPEANLPAAIACVWSVARAPRRGRAMIAVALGYVIPGAVYFAWRWWYYGELLPLPFHLKVTGAAAGPISGVRDVARFAIWSIAHVPVALLGWRSQLRLRAPALACWAAWFAFFLIPEHVMGYGHRFLFPLAPAWMAVGVAGIASVAEWPIATRQRWAAPALALLLAIGFLLESPRRLGYYDRYATGLREAHARLGEDLAAMVPHGEGELLAIGDAGIVPYRSQWPTIDTFGLNHREIALQGDAARARALRTHPPTVLVLISTECREFNPRLEHERPLVALGESLGLVHAASYRFGDTYWLWVMARPGRAFPTSATECLGGQAP